LTYHDWVIDKAAEIGSDGCTGVTNAYRWCCLEHDVLFRTGESRDGAPVTRLEANLRFRSCLRRSSPFGWWSPLAWWRWVAVQWYVRRSGQVLPRAFEEETAAQARRRILHEEGAWSDYYGLD
jgi:hypothetical protein